MMRSAVVLEIEIMCPIRLNNLASLTLGKHLLPYTNEKKKTGMRLFIPGTEVKNGEDIEVELPEALVGLIDEYLHFYRKALIKPECRHNQPIHLFPTPDGKTKSGKVLAQIVCDALKAVLGIEFNFHLFRHIGCYLYLKQRPGDYETMRRVLAHRNIETTARFYAEMEKEEAFRTFDHVMLELRESRQFEMPRPKTAPKPPKIVKIAQAPKPKPMETDDVL
jgi:integrase